MKSTMHYNTYSNRNTQEELQKLAGDIFQYGTIIEVHHHSYGTNRDSENGEMRQVRDGGLCYEVEGLKGSNTRYYIHTRGYRVTEIIEETNY